MLRVLFIDDCYEDYELTKINLDLLSSEIDLVIASSGEEALELLKTEEYDCIVSDFHIPDIDGLELLKTLKQEGSEIPFILHVGEDYDVIRTEAHAAGVDDYFTKAEVMNDYNLLSQAINSLAEQE